MKQMKCYSELILLPRFEERFRYLLLGGIVGQETFGFDRYMNQYFYRSKEWRRTRDIVIARDSGCDLGIPGHEILGRVLIHHMNPISPKDIRNRSDILLNPEYLITTVHETHQAIHYGDGSLLITAPIERVRNDTCPWKSQIEEENKPCNTMT